MQKKFFLLFGKHFILFSLCPVQTDSRFELHCSSDIVHIRTCSDSCAALMNLIQYIASYGDLHAANKAEMKPGAPERKTKVQLATSPVRINFSPTLFLPREWHIYISEAFMTATGRKETQKSPIYALPSERWVRKGDSMGFFGKSFNSSMFRTLIFSTNIIFFPRLKLF